MTASRAGAVLRIGVVGGGRTRNGLGPFLASFLEQGGGRVVGVVGRNPQRAALAAGQLAQRLGHEVAAHGELAALLESEPLDALIIASPVETHLPALRVASSAGVHVLCEKPLVSAPEVGEVPGLLAEFARQDRVLMENCQQPELLPALHQLFPDLAGEPVRELAMGLSPSGIGRQMVEDSLSHFLSVLQALLQGEAVGGISAVGYSSRDPDARSQNLDMRFTTADAEVDGCLELLHCVSQPRPAWLAVNGRRMERRIELPEYRQLFRCGDREIPVADPLGLLVYGFLQLVRQPDVERTRELRRRIHERAGLYAEILAHW
jgi:predicted dehydrogenase